jgi:Fe2+ transport system protein FeoA
MMDSSIALSELRTGQSALINSFHDTRAVTNRLASLGFTPGAEVQMTQNYGNGPLIVCVRGSRVALGRSEATKILVRLRSA